MPNNIIISNSNFFFYFTFVLLYPTLKNIEKNSNNIVMASNTKKVVEYKENLKKEAEELVLKGFPETITKLHELLETSQFKNPQFENAYQELNIPIPNNPILPPAKKPKYDNDSGSTLPSSSEPSNKKLVEFVETIKPFIRKLVEDLKTIKMWISIMVPKIEDGNNFGVSIQEMFMEGIQSFESQATSFFEQISKYYASRAKAISKVARYPYIEDYRRAVQVLDEKEYLSLWQTLRDAKDTYYFVHDHIVKNLDKIKTPRSSNGAESLMY